jgi:hypothetical protein
MFDKEIASQIEIEASTMAVWNILTDFENYARWNPFIIRAKGQAVEGSKLEGDFRPVGAKPTTLRPRLMKAVPGQELRWVGHFGMPGLFDAEHIFLIKPLGTNAVRLIQQETFSGLLVPFFKFGSSLAAFELMNQALKERVEKAAMALHY